MRDFLPGEAQRRRKLARQILGSFDLHGYSLVTLPAFELASVLERGLGTLDPGDVLRFVLPESGEVAALRPDMTPQIARMVATRLSHLPTPMRICYEGTVLRRRQERARKHRQIPQAGVELLGMATAEGDLELLLVAANTLEAAGLSNFVLDIGHAEIARALVAELPPELSPRVFDALAHKDADRIADLIGKTSKAPESAASMQALVELPRLHGDGAIWKEAARLLENTPAAASVAALRDVWERAEALGLGPSLRVDFGEVRGFAYYTGVVFQLFAEGPGEALGSGGRYDDLLARFGAPMPAAGFALDLDNLDWALRSAGQVETPRAKVLVIGEGETERLCAQLRREGIPCMPAPPDIDSREFALAWECSHLLAFCEGRLELTELRTKTRVFLKGLSEIAARLPS